MNDVKRADEAGKSITGRRKTITGAAMGIVAGLAVTGLAWTIGVPGISQASSLRQPEVPSVCTFDEPVNDILDDSPHDSPNKLAGFSETRFEVGENVLTAEGEPVAVLPQGNEDTQQDAVHADDNTNLDIELPPIEPAIQPHHPSAGQEPGNVPVAPVQPSASWTTSDFAKVTQRDFAGKSISEKVELIGAMARADMCESGILASVTAAQAILESGWMESSLARHNNLFGIKATANTVAWEGSTWTGTSVDMQTGEEYSPGQITTITAGFRTYPSIWASVKDHSSYLANAMKGSSKRYPGVAGCRDPRTCFQLIKDGGYATDSRYAEKLMRIVDCYDLTRFDD